MLSERPSLETFVSFYASQLSADYTGISNVWGVYYGSGNPIYEDPQDAVRLTRTSEAIARFVRTVESEDRFRTIVGRAIGIFDGQLYLWLITEALDTALTRSLFETKSAIEEELGSEFEIHVEPLGQSSIKDIVPSGYAVF